MFTRTGIKCSTINSAFNSRWETWKNWFCGIFLILALTPLASAADDSESFNAAPFGEFTTWDAQGIDYGVMWEDPRDIFQVVVVFAPGEKSPAPGSIQLQYWHSSWPQRRIPRDNLSGAGESGWLDVGDWHKGEWKTADCKMDAASNVLIFTFNPVNVKEFRDLGDFAAKYRTTMKLRLLGREPLPKVQTFEAYTDSVRKEMGVEILWDGAAGTRSFNEGRMEIFNGALKAFSPMSGGNIKTQPDGSWRMRSRKETNGISAKILYAEPKNVNSFDETVVTVRTKGDGFSFSVSDLLKWDYILLPDYGVLVRKAGHDITYKQALAKLDTRNKDIYSRVFDVGEQTFTQAWSDTPVKNPHYIPLSFEGGRQHFRLNELGNAECIKNWITRLPGKDTERCQWQGDSLFYNFGLPPSRLVDRTLMDGYLPIIINTWEASGIRYTQTAFVTPLNGVPNAGGRIWADDPLALMMRIKMENIVDHEVPAQLTISSSDGKGAETLKLDNDLVFAAAGNDMRLRMRLLAEKEALKIDKGRIRFLRKLVSRSYCSLEIAIPYITLSEPKEWAQLQALEFVSSMNAVKTYWENRVQSGAQIITPEPMINDFYKAHLIHLLINTEREVGVSDRYMAKVGTFHYGVYSNESCMMVSDLDRRGYSKLAERALDSWLHYQGSVPLPGDYSTTDGEFYGAGGYEAGGYNQHHGWVLWCMGEHYWHTRDSAWMKKAAPGIVKACEWIIRERSRNAEIVKKSTMRAIERGLLPQGSLEDIGDWRSWLSTNVYTWWGMANAAAALAADGFAEGERLMREAESYKQDILAAYTEAMRRSPVVRLRDGRWIPHIPSDVHRRGRSFGWITETLEGAIHMVRCGLLEPKDILSTWIIQDFEDNLYLSKQFGYDLTGEEFDRYWFSRGGISMQANLLCNPIPYLLRDEPKHFLRAYFNAFAVSYFPDTRMMTEHALPNIGDWRGDHYKSSDEANSTYWLRLMFVEERGDELWLGAAIPRYWLEKGQKIGIQNANTYFGPMSMEMQAEASGEEIRMTVDPPARNAPSVIHARFRHPENKRITHCTVNGRRYENFDADKEWVTLEKCRSKTEIVVYYN
ncbi:MAG: hypothetical protein AB1656_13725 [Candidatus Omnitrophota bacterium]